MPTPFDDHAQPHPAINLERVLQRSMDELLGVCKGVLVDGVVSEREVVALGEWLSANPHVAVTWPASIITQRLTEILNDAVIDDDERADLQGLLEGIAGGRTELNMRENRSTEIAFTDPPPTVLLGGREFCLTGRFAYGPRTICEEAIRSRGGWAHNNVRRATHYLVIGTFGSRDWLHSTHGTKIQKAVRYECPIVSEEHWASVL